jgi:hypothetical protein
MFRRHAPLVATVTGPSVGVPDECYEGCGTQPKLLLVCKPHIRPETIEAMIAGLEPALLKWPAPPRSSSSSSSPLPPRCEVLRMSAERARTPEGHSDFAAAWGAGLPIVVTDATAGFPEQFLKAFSASALLTGLDPTELFVDSSFASPIANGAGGAGPPADILYDLVDVSVKQFLKAYNGGAPRVKGKPAKVKDLPPDQSFYEWRPHLFALFMSLLAAIAPTYVCAGALNLLKYFPFRDKPPDAGPKGYIALRGQLDADGDPICGLTPTHMDMSHAANVALSAGTGNKADAVVATWNLWHRADQEKVTPPSRAVAWALGNRAAVLRPLLGSRARARSCRCGKRWRRGTATRLQRRERRRPTTPCTTSSAGSPRRCSRNSFATTLW